MQYAPRHTCVSTEANCPFLRPNHCSVRFQCQKSAMHVQFMTLMLQYTHNHTFIEFSFSPSQCCVCVCVCEFSHSLDVCHNSDVRTSFMIYTQNLFLLFCSFLVWAHEQLKTIIQFTHNYLVCFRECSFSEMHSIRSHSYRRAAYTQTYSNVKANA